MTERRQTQEERGRTIKNKAAGGRRFLLWATAALAATAISAIPRRAYAAGTWETSAAQIQVGTLPLLAALGIGIAVAVVAVIAFLQLTAKGRESNDSSFASEDERGPNRSPRDDQIWDEEEAASDEEVDDGELTDYTIPMTRVLAFNGQAEQADDREPRLLGLDGEHAGQSYRVLNRRLTFGRDPARCAILFPLEAGEISRVHCTLRYMEETRLFVLEDNGSSNGTFLASGERLKPGVRYELRSGERFFLSGGEHRFEVADVESRAI